MPDKNTIPDGTTPLGYGHDGYSVTVADGMVTIATPSREYFFMVGDLPWQLLDAIRREDQLREACEEQYAELQERRECLPAIVETR